jgi:hypothetical protein
MLPPFPAGPALPVAPAAAPPLVVGKLPPWSVPASPGPPVAAAAPPVALEAPPAEEAPPASRSRPRSCSASEEREPHAATASSSASQPTRRETSALTSSITTADISSSARYRDTADWIHWADWVGRCDPSIGRGAPFGATSPGLRLRLLRELGSRHTVCRCEDGQRARGTPKHYPARLLRQAGPAEGDAASDPPRPRSKPGRRPKGGSR